MKAMILAAGVGSRLDPLTRSVPKPMVPVVNRPVIEHILAKLKKHGVTQVMVNLHYLGDVIKDHLGNGAKYGVKVSYAHEDRLWGDAGSVKRAEEFFRGDTFLVVGGDDISDIDLSRLVKFHQDKKAVSTLALSLVDDPSEYGIVLTNERSRITRFLEKPKGGAVFSNTANTGIYVFEPEVFDVIPRGVPFGFGRDVFPLLLEQKKPLYGFLSSAYWRDVGSLSVYRRTHFDALEGRVSLEFPVPPARRYVWIGEDARIDPAAQIGYPVLIGSGVTIEAGAQVLDNTVIGDNCTIESNAVLRETILWQGATVKRGTHLERCIVGGGCQVHSDAAIFDGIIINPSRRADK